MANALSAALAALARSPGAAACTNFHNTLLQNLAGNHTIHYAPILFPFLSSWRHFRVPLYPDPAASLGAFDMSAELLDSWRTMGGDAGLGFSDKSAMATLSQDDSTGIVAAYCAAVLQLLICVHDKCALEIRECGSSGVPFVMASVIGMTDQQHILSLLEFLVLYHTFVQTRFFIFPQPCSHVHQLSFEGR